MKKYAPIYRGDSITYWPYHQSSVGLSILLSITVAVSVMLSILILVYPGWSGKVLPIVILWLVTACSICGLVCIRKIAFTEVIVSADGLRVSNPITRRNLNVQWDDITEIRYQYQYRYGLESCVIVYKVPYYAVSGKRIHHETFRLPLYSVSKDELMKFLPKMSP